MTATYDMQNSRESIISLFDPLSTPPHTPTRDTHSPDSASDKENDGPAVQPGQLTAFFNRVYTHPKAVSLPRGKLIDFGDVSFDADEDAIAGDLCAGRGNEADEDATDGLSGRFHAESVDKVAQTPEPVQRRPLMDIKLERTPVQDARLLQTAAEQDAAAQPALAHSRSEDGGSETHASVAAAPFGTPLADIINSINLGVMNIDEPRSPRDAAAGDICPDITVVPPTSAPPSPSPASATVPPESASLLSPSTSASVFSVPVRRQHATTSPHDPRRASVDLYSSFSMQMQSSDMSFDLLNDKISFLAQQDQDSFSFWGGSGIDEEDTMDLAKEELRMKLTAEKYEAIKEEEEIEPVPQEKLRSKSPIFEGICARPDAFLVEAPPKPTSGDVLEDRRSPLRAPVFTEPPPQSAIIVHRAGTSPYVSFVSKCYINY